MTETIVHVIFERCIHYTGNFATYEPHTCMWIINRSYDLFHMRSQKKASMICRIWYSYIWFDTHMKGNVIHMRIICSVNAFVKCLCKMIIQVQLQFCVFCFQQCHKESGNKLSMKDLIVRPIQRIPRYELLLQVGTSFRDSPDTKYYRWVLHVNQLAL